MSYFFFNIFSGAILLSSKALLYVLQTFDQFVICFFKIFPFPTLFVVSFDEKILLDFLTQTHPSFSLWFVHFES